MLILDNLGDMMKGYIKSMTNKFRNAKGDRPQIEIHMPAGQRDPNPPQITIKRTHIRAPEPSGEPQEDPGKDIGGGIRVKKQGKPKICPICKSPARDNNNNDNIVDNPNGGKPWLCKICDNTF